MPRGARTDDLPRAALLMVSASLLFAGMGLCVKLAGAALPNTAVVFFRNLFGLLALLPWLWPLARHGFGTRHPWEHATRSLVGLASMYCFFFALARLPLAEAVLLNYSLPLFMPLVERAWSGERRQRRIWPPLAIGFAGVALVLKPGLGLFRLAALAALASALLASIAQVGVRRLTATEPPERIVLYFGVISTSVSALPLAASWPVVPGPLWTTLVLMGLLATGGQLAMTRAYSHAAASRVGPFIYTSVLFAGALDWAVNGVVPDRLSLAGAALVVSAGVLALRTKDAAAATPAS